jgi:hypothetical protein
MDNQNKNDFYWTLIPDAAIQKANEFQIGDVVIGCMRNGDEWRDGKIIDIFLSDYNYKRMIVVRFFQFSKDNVMNTFTFNENGITDDKNLYLPYCIEHQYTLEQLLKLKTEQEELKELQELEEEGYFDFDLTSLADDAIDILTDKTHELFKFDLL